MKQYTLILLFSIFFTIIHPQNTQFSPENTLFAFDIDDVIVHQPTIYSIARNIMLVTGGIWNYPTNSHNWIASLIGTKKCYKRDADGKKEKLLDEEGNEINGLAFHFLYHGMRDPNLAFYVPRIVNTIEYWRAPIDGTVELCQYLKNKGYIVVFATNKDRPSYDEFAKYADAQVTNLPEKVFVAHFWNEDFRQKIKNFAKQPSTPKNYKIYAKQALTVAPTEHIKHVPTAKPDPSYYEYVHKSHNKKHMVFVDDKKVNIDGVEKYNEQLTDESAIGLRFENPYLLAQDLLKIGILSAEKDRVFLERMKKYK